MKNNTLKFLSALIAGSLFSGAAHAESDLKPFAGVSAGTSGFGLQLGLQIKPGLSVRLLTNNLTLDETMEIDGIDYELEVDLAMPQLVVDYHPFDSGFYLSAGLTANSSSLGGLATLSEPVTIGSATVRPEDVGALRARASYDATSPYVGLGWRSSDERALSWQFELGATTLPEPDISLAEEGSNFISQADLDAEAELILDDIEDELSIYPHLRVGVRYRF